MLLKTRRLQLLDLILGSKTTAVVSIVNWFELEKLKKTMIAAGQIPYQNVPNGEEKQIRFEDLPAT